MVAVVLVLLILVISAFSVFLPSSLASPLEKLDVPYFNQADERWSHDLMVSSEYEIWEYGCALTSTAMVLNYYGVHGIEYTFNDYYSGDTNPKDLNQWLRGDNGYTSDNLLIWAKVEDYSDARDRGVSFEILQNWNIDNGYLEGIEATEVALLQDEIISQHPVIVGVYAGIGSVGYPDHWVVITGIEGETFFINDPYWQERTTLSFYNNRIYGIRVFHGIPLTLAEIIYVPDDYPTIQKAVDAASEGDTITVRDGTYIENVDVTKSLIISSENGPEVTLVQASDSNDHIFEIKASRVNVSGFTIQGATGNNKAGIYSYDSSISVSDLTLLDNNYGIYTYSTLWSPLRVSDSIFFGNNRGIYSHSSFESRYGEVYVSDSTFSDNTYGIYTSDFCGIRVINSTFFNNDYGIYGHNRMSIHAEHSNFSNNSYGIYGNSIWGINSLHSNFYDNNYGIYAVNGWDNTLSISYSNFRNNNWSIYYRASTLSSHIFFLNNFINNIRDVDVSPSEYVWNSPDQITYTYNSKTYSNYLGNYWSDYKGSDMDGDGIGDIPYSINSDKDNYPLVNHYENYVLEASPDNFADLGNLKDEALHNLKGWGDAQAPPKNPYVSPSGDQTKRYQLLRQENSLDLFVSKANVPYLLITEVEDGICTDNFEIYINGEGPVYSYIGKNVGSDKIEAIHHEIPIPASYITGTTVKITFKNTATDDYGLAAVYNVQLIPTTVIPNQPPIASFTYSPTEPRSGEWVIFDASNSYDPDGDEIISYKWDFGNGETAEGIKTIHRFRGTMDGLKTYSVTLAVEDYREGTSFDTVHIIVRPLEKTLEVKPGYLEEIWMSVSYNWVGIDEVSGEDAYIISKITSYSGGLFGVYQLLITREDTLLPTILWHDALPTLPILRTYTSPFTPTIGELGVSLEITTLTFPDGIFEGVLVRATDVMNIVVSATAGFPLVCVDTASTAFYPDAPIEPANPLLKELLDLLIGRVYSPAELRVYDSQGRVTGLVDGEAREEIPNSIYFENTVAIFSPADSYHYEVVGAKRESYGLLILQVQKGEEDTFTATEIPIREKAIHRYTIDWEVLSQGKKGVALQIDADGDGVYERSIKTGATLLFTEIEVKPWWEKYWYIIAITVAICMVIPLVVKRKHKKI